MKVKRSLQIWVVFTLLVLIAVVVPTEAYASQNGYVNECIKDTTLCGNSAPTDAEADNTESASVSMGPWEYIKILLALIFVLALLIGVLKFLNKRNLNYQQNSIVRNIGGLSVGAQKSVQLLHIGNHLYVIGVGEDVQLIKEITNPAEIEQILAYYNDKHTSVGTAPYITELFKKKSTKKVEKQTLNFGNMLDQRLSEIKKERSDELERWKEKENDK
ncbi:flagellar biosynthetic protein FliO [Solibacillus sp. CAU 1738]|uniref:flagellar biosynthetic protein FliO n=1 Tax=Solibacillus sp. CAU 1738 TaxID=3140363 RepID=UPI0032617D96